MASNNSIITVPSNGRIQPLKCLTGSNNTTLGRVYQPNGLDITSLPNDIFDVDNSMPGVIKIELKTGFSILSNHQGVYTCVIPDENDMLQYIYFALYRTSYDSKLAVCQLYTAYCTKINFYIL